MATITGTNGDDRLRSLIPENGDDQNHTVLGLAGNDTISDLFGADRIFAGPGDDFVGASPEGEWAFTWLNVREPDEDGNVRTRNVLDLETRPSSNDAIYGAAGNDTIVVTGGNDFVDGGDGIDLLEVGASPSVVSFQNDVGRRYAERTDTRDYREIPVVVDLAAGMATYAGISGSVTLANIDPAISPNAIVHTRSFTNVGVQNHTIKGFEIVAGGLGRNVARGDGKDNAFLSFESSITWTGTNDVYDGRGGSDFLFYQNAPQGMTIDLVTERAVANDVPGERTGFSDRIISIEHVAGSQGDDVIRGTAGVNFLTGRGGNDTIDGRAGLDWVVFSMPTGLDIGQVLAPQFDFVTRGVEVDLAAGTAKDGIGGTDTLVSIERALGSINDDRLLGDIASDVLIGVGGDDFINGRAGNDRLSGGDGDDTIYGGSGRDQIFGVNDDDFIDGGANADALYGGSGEDTIRGGDGNDRIFGQADADRLFGDAGNDVIQGQFGNDRLEGGVGNDALFGGDGLDRMFGQAGNDRLFGEAGTDIMDGGAGKDLLEGGADNDRLLGGAGNDRLEGGAGDDSLNGGDGIDVLVGGIGDDVMVGGAGGDLLIAGVGNDTYGGGAGVDNLLFTEAKGGIVVDLGAGVARGGGLGVNKVFNIENASGWNGRDILRGTDGANLLNGGRANDRLVGQGGDDRLFGEIGDDVLFGGNGDDVLFGDKSQFASRQDGNGRDTLDGGAGDDVLVGGGNIDTLIGGLGDDVLNGQAGDDSLRGNQGADRFVTSTGQDTILDFQLYRDSADARPFINNGVSNDVIDVSGMGTAMTFRNYFELTDAARDYNVGGATGTIINQGGNSLILQGIQIEELGPRDFVFA